MLIKSYPWEFEAPSFFFIFVFMGTEHYIEELLYRYNCVVVPEFGAFLTQMKSAVIQQATHTFLPPTKVISFNEQLSSNDGLLVSYMASAEKETYEEKLSKTLEVAEEWKNKLRKGERLALSNIGELWLNREGKIQFQPSYKVNYLTSSFGLASFVSVPTTREVLKEQVVEMEEKIPFIITPEERKKHNFRPLMRYAAVMLLALATGLTGYKIYDETLSKQQIVREDAQVRLHQNIQEATFFDATPMELPPLNIELTKKRSSGNHHIIAGAFRIRANADKKIRQLKRKGFTSASYLGVNRFGLHQVTYGSYTSSEEALEKLKIIKRTDSRDAWLLSTRK